jgi:hypothetical protein
MVFRLSVLSVLAVLALPLAAHAEVSVEQLELVSETAHGATVDEKGRMNLDEVFAKAGLPKADPSVTEDSPTDIPSAPVPGSYPSSYTSSSYPASYTSSSYPSSYTSTSYPSSYTSTSYPSSYTSTSYPSSYTSSSYPSSYTSGNAAGEVRAPDLQGRRYSELPMPQLAQ